MILRDIILGGEFGMNNEPVPYYKSHNILMIDATRYYLCAWLGNDNKRTAVWVSELHEVFIHKK